DRRTDAERERRHSRLDRRANQANRGERVTLDAIRRADPELWDRLDLLRFKLDALFGRVRVHNLPRTSRTKPSRLATRSSSPPLRRCSSTLRLRTRPGRLTGAFGTTAGRHFSCATRSAT